VPTRFLSVNRRSSSCSAEGLGDSQWSDLSITNAQVEPTARRALGKELHALPARQGDHHQVRLPVAAFVSHASNGMAKKFMSNNKNIYQGREHDDSND
jgi:hypothetical protein